MSARWGTKGLVETGFNAIVFFKGTLTGIEEDLPSDYPDPKGKIQYQTKFTWTDIELLAWEAPQVIEDGELRKFVTQKDTKKSTWGQLQRDIETFANRQHLEGVLPDCIKDEAFIWARVEYSFGAKVSPGMAWVPVDTIENIEKYQKGLVEGGSIDTGKDASGGKGPKIPDSIEPVVEKAVFSVTKDGATKDEIKQALIGKGPSRKGMATAGGVDSVIAYLLGQGTLAEEDGKFHTVKTEDEAEAPAAD